MGLWAPLGDMLARGCVDVNARDEHGMSALLVCAEEGHDECVDQLIRAGAKVDQPDAVSTHSARRKLLARIAGATTVDKRAPRTHSLLRCPG